jgi:MFS family permease
MRSSPADPGAARARRATAGAALVSGSADIADFLVPLWAGAEIGASPAQIGAMVAVELAVSVLVRPLAGRLVDTRERTRVAAAGAALYALSCLGYALAPGAGVAVLAAAVGGAGGGLLWIAVRAITAERLGTDSGAFASLFSAVALAAWCFWVPAKVLLPVLGYPGIFGAFALACAVAAFALVRAPATGRPAVDRPPTRPLRADVRLLGPLLGVVALTNVAEGGIGLLLLLHLSEAFDLDVYQIALVRLPGALALTLLPRPLHRLALRHGRRAVYVAASLGSATFALALAAAPGPLVIALAWVLTSAAWAALSPVHEAVVAEVSGGTTGRGMSLLSNAVLIGGAVGSAVVGVLYQATSWAVVCVLLAAVIAVGAVGGPWALRRLGVTDRPTVGVPPGDGAGDDGPAT